MRPMNAFADARLEAALARIDSAIGLLDGYVDTCARNILQKAKGDLVAMRQLLQLEAELAQHDSDTQHALQRALRSVR